MEAPPRGPLERIVRRMAADGSLYKLTDSRTRPDGRGRSVKPANDHKPAAARCNCLPPTEADWSCPTHSWPAARARSEHLPAPTRSRRLALLRKRLRQNQKRPEPVTLPLQLDNARREPCHRRRSANSTPPEPPTHTSNAALSGRGPTTHQETSNSLPAVRLNA
jgi:hypothetical protein